MATAGLFQFRGTNLERKNDQALRVRVRERRQRSISGRIVDALAPFVVIDGADDKRAAIRAEQHEHREIRDILTMRDFIVRDAGAVPRIVANGVAIAFGT